MKKTRQEAAVTVQETAAGVLDIIPNHRRWAKNHEESFNGTRHCILGALVHMDVSDLLIGRFQKKMGLVLKAEYPEKCQRWYEDGVYLITQFNDDDDIRYADVRRVLEKMRAL